MQLIPALLLAAFLVACAIAVIPTALTLFAIFLAIKYAVLAINGDKSAPIESPKATHNGE